MSPYTRELISQIFHKSDLSASEVLSKPIPVFSREAESSLSHIFYFQTY